MEKIPSLKRVIFITRSFPPSTLTAAARATSFANNLHKYGYFPIVVTRDWNFKFRKYEDIYKPSGTRVMHEVNKNFEVYYIPFNGRFAMRKWAQKNKVFQKMAVLWDIYAGWHYRLDPHFGLVKFSEKILKLNSDIRHVLISVPPFSLLSFASFLKKRHSVKIVVDYRDEWNTRGTIIQEESRRINIISRSILRLLNGKKVRIKREMSLLTNVSSIITISEDAKVNLSMIFNGDISVLPNGYDKDEIATCSSVKSDSEVFQISYAGWLYESQQIEILLDAVKLMSNNHKGALKLKLIFIGGESFPGMKERIVKYMNGYEKYLTFTPRVDKLQSLAIQKRSSLLLLVAHRGNGSIPSSKLYEYIALERQILCAPSDYGILQHTLSENAVGCWSDDVDSTLKILEEYYQYFLNGENYKFNVSGIHRHTYERAELVSRVGEIFNRL